MKKRFQIAFFLLIMSVSTLFSQSNKYIGLEIAGAYGLSGFSFDNRFTADSKFGYKIGLGYGFEYHSGVRHWYFTPVKAYRPEDEKMNQVLSIPLNAHYLFGKKKHFLETGLGVSIFFTNYSFGNDSRVGYFPYGRVAYRFESSTNPLMLSLGIETPFRTPGSGLGYSFGLSPSVTIGYRLY